ncbi:hypothetical protein FB45DRAFT_870552 [Roridomyces roridus]|uniref:Uncharacterized protein n=1 Tax=Roridomyces roridus TaxID=1738132 RepID=A0AAD7BJ32_9AGAR|nr:hypothetical protein FB45DRAFT_870552 [Roridomyces roridus]
MQAPPHHPSQQLGQYGPSINMATQLPLSYPPPAPQSGPSQYQGGSGYNMAPYHDPGMQSPYSHPQPAYQGGPGYNMGPYYDAGTQMSYSYPPGPPPQGGPTQYQDGQGYNTAPYHDPSTNLPYSYAGAPYHDPGTNLPYSYAGAPPPPQP